MGRDAKVAAFTGMTGTGKSYLAKQKAKIYSKGAISKTKIKDSQLPRLGGKVLVLSYTGSGNSWSECRDIVPTQEGFSKFKRGWRLLRIVKHENEMDIFKNIFTYFKNGVIIFDDCKQYLSAAWSNNKSIIDILNEHRHRGYDLFFIAHSPQHIPRQIWAYISHVFLFKISVALKEGDMASDGARRIIEKQKIVNKRFLVKFYENKNQKPRGIYEYLQV